MPFLFNNFKSSSLKFDCSIVIFLSSIVLFVKIGVSLLLEIRKSSLSLGVFMKSFFSKGEGVPIIDPVYRLTLLNSLSSAFFCRLTLRNFVIEFVYDIKLYIQIFFCL